MFGVPSCGHQIRQSPAENGGEDYGQNVTIKKQEADIKCLKREHLWRVKL